MINNIKNELQNLSVLVNKGLDNYISVHNRIYNESGTFMSLFKNMFGKGVSNKELLKYSEDLKPEWHNILNELDKYKEEKYSNLNNVEADFFDKLFFYSNAVNKTIDVLIKKQSLLLEKSLNNSMVSFNDYNKIELEYENCIQEYRKAGVILNITYLNMISN